MKRRQLPAQETLLRILSYDATTGVLTRRRRDDVPSYINNRFAEKPAGKLGINGYIYVSINYDSYLAHRVIWKMVYGTDPVELDHKNRCRSDNRLENLREATRSQNLANSPRQRIYPRGVRPIGRRYRAEIGSRNTRRYLGCFDTAEEASTAFAAAAQEMFGDFARLD